MFENYKEWLEERAFGVWRNSQVMRLKRLLSSISPNYIQTAFLTTNHDLVGYWLCSQYKKLWNSGILIIGNTLASHLIYSLAIQPNNFKNSV